MNKISLFNNVKLSECHDTTKSLFCRTDSNQRRFFHIMFGMKDSLQCRQIGDYTSEISMKGFKSNLLFEITFCRK